MSLDEFAAALDVVVKDHVEAVAQLRDGFQARVNAVLTEAVGNATDLSDGHAALFARAMVRMQKLIDEV